VDNRHYGIFYHEIHPKDPTKWDEAAMTLNFYDRVQPTAEEKKQIRDLIILLVEDFKLKMGYHQAFREKKIFLSTAGFIVGQDKIKQLHTHTADYTTPANYSCNPGTLWIPVGKAGGSIHMEGSGSKYKRYKKQGEAIYFDAYDVTHAGAPSASNDKLDELALHLHFDTTQTIGSLNELTDGRDAGKPNSTADEGEVDSG
jgi:hypothetical protein